MYAQRKFDAAVACNKTLKCKSLLVLFQTGLRNPGFLTMLAAAAEVPWTALSKAAGACDELLPTLPNRGTGACCAEGFGTCRAEKRENHDETCAKWAAQQATLLKARSTLVSKQSDAGSVVTGCKKHEDMSCVG